MKRVYAQLTYYTYTRCDVSYIILRLAPTIHCILTSLAYVLFIYMTITIYLFIAIVYALFHYGFVYLFVHLIMAPISFVSLFVRHMLPLN